MGTESAFDAPMSALTTATEDVAVSCASLGVNPNSLKGRVFALRRGPSRVAKILPTWTSPSAWKRCRVQSASESRPVAVRHIPAATGLEKCHIVYIGRSEQGRFKAVLTKLARLPILTVGDIADFAQEGGMIGLVEAEQRIRFNINLAAARQANLKLSSQLLKLATIVE